MGRKRVSTVSKADEFLDWFEDQADDGEREYVLNYLDRLKRRNTVQAAGIPVTASTDKKPRSTGAAAKNERQAKAKSTPSAATPVRRTGFGGGTPPSTLAKGASAGSDEGDTSVDVE